MLIAGAAVVAILATSREQDPRVAFDTTEGVAPLINPGGDHWHDAYLIHHCGEDLPPGTDQNGPGGIHSHADGLIHVHPSQAWAAGNNANFGLFVDAMGGELSDEVYTPGPGEVDTVLSEAEGCDGEPAVLQLAFWADPFSDADPVIITEDIAKTRFDDPRANAYTLALLPEGAEIPKPNLIALAEYTGQGGLGSPVTSDDATTGDATTDDATTDEDGTAEESPEDDDAAEDSAEDDGAAEDSAEDDGAAEDE